MDNNWGPHYIIPSETIKSYSGNVLLRESLDEELLYKDLKQRGISGYVINISNPWYYRTKSDTTWIKIGESNDKENNFAVKWDTTKIPNGKYEIMGLMHVSINTEKGVITLTRQNIVEVTVEN